MRIQHNIPAMNAYRNFTINNSALSKNLEKLSAGYKINRAGDDAAGLAISEKMRAQITGLEVAQKNAKDGISLVQTAEGALTEVHDMLNRMVTLAEQSANGTYADDVDREQLQKEVDQLRMEINRIADSSNFNGINLLDGSLGLNKAAFSAAVGTDLIETGNLEVAGVIATAPATAASQAGWAALATAANPVANDTNTILKTDSGSAQLGEFTIDLQNLTVAKGSSNSAASTASVQFQFTMSLNGDTALTVNVASGSSISTKNIAAAIRTQGKFVAVNGNGTMAAFAAATGASSAASFAGAGGLIYQVATGTGTQLTYKLYAYKSGSGSTAASVAVLGTGSAALTKLQNASSIIASGALDVMNNLSVEFNDVTTASVAGEVLNGWNLGAYDVKQTSTGASGQLANTKVKLDMSKIQDGYQITVAGETYTFAVGSKSKVAASTTNRIDLTNYENLSASATGAGAVGTDAVKQNDVMSIITAAMDNNKIFTVGNDVAATGTRYGRLTLAERDGLNYSKGTGALSTSQMKSIKTALMSYGTSVSDETGIRSLVKVTDGTSVLKSGFEVNLKDASEIADGDALKVSIGSKDNLKVYNYTFSKGTTALGVTGSTSKGVRTAKVTFTGTETAKEILQKIADDIGTKTAYVTSAATGAKLQIINDDGPVKILGTGLTLQIGDTSNSFNQLNVALQDMHTTSLGIAGIDISTQSGAAAALDKIKAAINTVSDVRGTLGATQNRLDHTINNLSVMRENIQDAESTIRDTDVAEEMMAYTKNSILNQAAQAMLAQANQLPQGVLQLLQ